MVRTPRSPDHRNRTPILARRRLEALQEPLFRNHKGNRHYLVAFDCEQNLAIHDLERRLRQGKLVRLEQRMGAGSTASRLGVALRADQRPEHHVHLFLDRNLERFPAYSFHPNDNRATVVVSRKSSCATSPP
ncbi:MAG: hypothetical protein ACLRMJ_06785 [Alistipes finegoldii]